MTRCGAVLACDYAVDVVDGGAIEWNALASTVARLGEWIALSGLSMSGGASVVRFCYPQFQSSIVATSSSRATLRF